MKLSKIVSGAQTGADRAGLDAAMDFSLPHGGWCPRGRRAEDGTIPEKYDGLKETGSQGYLVRTKLNATCSHGTVVFTFGPPRSGSQKTIEFAMDVGRPFIHINLAELDDWGASKMVEEWMATSLKDVNNVVLNVAGSRESSSPGIGARVRTIMGTVILKTRGEP